MGKDRTDKGTNSSHWADVGGLKGFLSIRVAKKIMPRG